MTDTSDILGPIDYLVAEFPGNRFNGQVLPALTRLIADGTVRVLDLAFVTKDADGTVAFGEIGDLDDGEVGPLKGLSAFLADVLSEDDLAAGDTQSPFERDGLCSGLDCRPGHRGGRGAAGGRRRRRPRQRHLAVIGPTAGRYLIDISSGVPPKHFVQGEWFVGTAVLTGGVWVALDAAGADDVTKALLAFAVGFTFRLAALYRGWEEPLASEPAGVYVQDEGRPLLGRKLKHRSQRELRDLGLLPEEDEHGPDGAS